MKYTRKYFIENKIDISFIENELIIHEFRNNKEDEHLLFYIELSRLMKTKTYREALNYLKQMKIPSDCSKDLCEGIKLILQHFDSFMIQNNNKNYLDVSDNLLSKCNSNSNYEKTLLLWFIEKENDNQFINLNSYKDKIQSVINELYNNNKSKLLANLLLSISLNLKNNPHDLYNSIKDIMNKCIKEEQNKDYHLLYSLFYVWLVEQMKVYDKVKHIKIGTYNVDNKPMHLDVHCVFLYLHDTVRGILLTKDNDIATIIKDIDKCDNNKTIDPFKYNKNYSSTNEFEYIESKVDKDALGWLQSNENTIDNINKKKMEIKLNNYVTNNGYKYIIYFDFVLSFAEEDLKDIKVLEINEYYYELTGIFITDKSNKKYLILYNRNTLQWYYFNQSQWSNKLILPNQIDIVNLIYFRTNKDEINLDVQLNYETNITLFNDENKDNDNDIYWKSFKRIESLYPNILFVKEPFFKSAFNWDKTKHLQSDKDNNLLYNEESSKPNTETNKPIEEIAPLNPSENNTINPDSLNQNNTSNDNVNNVVDNEGDNKQNIDTNTSIDGTDLSIPSENPNADSLNQNNTPNNKDNNLLDNKDANIPNAETNQLYNKIDPSIPIDNLTTAIGSLNIIKDDTSYLDQFEQLLHSESPNITEHTELHKWIQQQFYNDNQHYISIKLLFYISFMTLFKSVPSPPPKTKPLTFNNQSILNARILTNFTTISSSLEIHTNINIQQLLANINKETMKEHNNYLFLIQMIIILLSISTNNNTHITNTQTFLKEDTLSYEEQYLNDLIILLRFTGLEEAFCNYVSLLLRELKDERNTNISQFNLNVLLNIYIAIHTNNEHIFQQCTFINDFAKHDTLIIDTLMEHDNNKRIIDILTLFTNTNEDINYSKNKSNEDNINNIKQYLKDNYTNIRKRIEKSLNESSQLQIIESFDKEFLDKSKHYDLLGYLEQYLFSVNSSICDDILLNLIENP